MSEAEPEARSLIIKRLPQENFCLIAEVFFYAVLPPPGMCAIFARYRADHGRRWRTSRAEMAHIFFCAACRCGAVGGWNLLICWISIKRKILITTPVQVVGVIRILWRFLADSNRRARFCRPLTKPLIQGTLSFSFAMQRYTFFLICKNTQMKISSFVAFIFAFFGLVP